jgi:hypothetical protein
MCAQEISATRFVDLCLGLVVSEIIILLHTHTHMPYFFKTSLTNFISTPHTVHTRHSNCVAVTNRDWPNFVWCCFSLPTCTIISSVSLTMRNQKSLYMIFAEITDAVARSPYFFILAVPNQFRYLVWGQQPGSLMHRHSRMLTQKRIFGLAYYFTVETSGNQWNASWLIARLFTHQSVYSYISNCSWYYKSSGVS